MGSFPIREPAILDPAQSAPRRSPSPTYKWAVVAMLWVICFFNYADRQAIFSVFPLLKEEMQLTDVQLGIVGASFMWVYALSAPLAGVVADRFSRKALIIGGFLFWSLITVATAYSTRYLHLVALRALEGFGEAFYFPASLALLSDYHGSETRSRAMSWHQSSVYAGTIAGGTVAGYLAQHFGWRSGFYVFGYAGVVASLVLMWFLKEPERPQAQSEAEPAETHLGLDWKQHALWLQVSEIFRLPMARALTAVFIGANFVAMIFLTWMPSYLYRKFSMSLSLAGLSGTVYLQIASVFGVLCGGMLADRFVLKSSDGRMRVQALGLFCGVPFLLLTGWTTSVTVLVLAMTCFGFCKGLYDANIWASLYDVVSPNRRATACGLMNSLGWLGGGTAPVAIAFASQRWGMGACLSATAAVYLVFGVLLTASFRRYMKAPSTALNS